MGFNQVINTRIPNSFTALTAHMKLLADEAAAEMEKLTVNTKKKAATKTKANSTKEDKANEKKRKATSHGVQQLKKANTKGMAKLSSFFQPKAAS